jgi:septal ring factor EnvC (AmiA/AmiB activator)
MIQISHEVTLTVETCCVCGTPFAIEATLQEQFKKTGNSFFCPNGHKQHYSESTDEKIKQLEKQLKQSKDDEAWWRQQAEKRTGELATTKKALSTTRSQLTRTKKRIAAGICPECHRQFANLHNHMANKHPDYASDTKSITNEN